MALLGPLFVGGLIAGSILAGIVYVDSARRRLPTASRLRRTVALGAVGFGGFLVPYAFSQQLEFVYFRVIKSEPIVATPYEWVAVHLATGVLIGASFAVFYFVASRTGSLDTI